MHASADQIARDILLKALRVVMKTAVCLVGAILLVLHLPVIADALQTGTMRCRDGIVSIHDTMAEVMKKCGSPAFQDRREETNAYGLRHNRYYETVTIDTWTYNFGSYEFMYEITFRNGRVAKIDSLDTGY